MGESSGRSRDLLQPGEALPFTVEREDGASPFVIVSDHAGRAVPRGLDLGVPAAEMDRHIAWDIGVGDLALALGERLDACVVRQPYSRLVIDCNRATDRADAMPAVSDGTPIRANHNLTAEARAQRIAAIHTPYHARLAEVIDARQAAGRRTLLILLHSFTPQMAGFRRPWRYGVLHTGEPYALAVLERLRAADVGDVGDNEPYAMDDVDYTAGRHGRDRGLDFVELEVRQDLIADAEDRAPVIELLTGVFAAALDDLDQR